jgi:hypothetical protein
LNPQSGAALAVGDKRQVFPPGRNRKNLVNRYGDLNLRKFSIDDTASFERMLFADVYHFETIASRIWKLCVHHSRRMQSISAANTAVMTCLWPSASLP